MRIVGGDLKGRTLPSPKTNNIRPTTDRARESLFNILAHSEHIDLHNARVLDLFAGTGALGFEAISRGAAFVLFVDQGQEARGLIRQSIMTFQKTGHTKLYKRDATKLGDRGALEPFNLVFLDPPYGKGLGEQALASAYEGGWLQPNAFIVWEEAIHANMTLPSFLKLLDERKSSSTIMRLLLVI